jgi:hypothetical protein
VFRRYDIGDDAELHEAMSKVERRHKEQSGKISTNVSTQPPEQVVQ